MGKYTYLSAIVILAFSCRQETAAPKNDISTHTADAPKGYKNWHIGPGTLGPIKAGANISDYKTVLAGLDATGVDAFAYKYDGGGQAYEYRYKGRLLFTLMPYMYSDSIIAIMAIDPGFTMKNGIHAGSTISQLAEKDINTSIRYDELAGGEFVWDGAGMRYIFDTADDSLVADYPTIDNPGIIKRRDAKCSWIEIKKP